MNYHDDQFPSCTQLLRAQGLAYPRTCHECGLGPCKRLLAIASSPAIVSNEIVGTVSPVMNNHPGQPQMPEPAGFRYRVCEVKSRRRVWTGEWPMAIITEWGKPMPPPNDVIQYDPVYTADQLREYGRACVAAAHDVAYDLIDRMIDISEHGVDEEGEPNYTAEGMGEMVTMAYEAVRQNEWYFGGRPKPASPPPEVQEAEPVAVKPPSGDAEDDRRDAERLAKYYELIFAVASKFPGESRHETALRYIRERENTASASEGDAAMLAKGEGNG